jgi:hypothetical protein
MTTEARFDGAQSATAAQNGETTTAGEGSRDLMLVALTVASGAVDAISYFGLGKIFSAFMTGNIVFLGFGIANMKEPCLPPVLALSTFAAGSFSRPAGGNAALPRVWVVAVKDVGPVEFGGDRRGRLPGRVDGNGRTSLECNRRCPPRPVLADVGHPDRRSPIAWRTRGFHHSSCMRATTPPRCHSRSRSS